MSEVNIIKPIDSVEKINKNKNSKVEYIKDSKEKDNYGFDELLENEQKRLRELDKILKEKKLYVVTLKEIYEKEKGNIDGKISNRLNSK